MGSNASPLEGQQDCYVLRWNDFHLNVASNFQRMRQDGDFLDTTVACGGDEAHQLRAHRVVLAASSSYFKGMLKNCLGLQQHSTVLVMPPGVRFRDLACLLEFIYHGEVRIPTDDISSFMALAELLQVKGLTEDKEEPQEQHSLPSMSMPADLAASGQVEADGEEQGGEAGKAAKMPHFPPSIRINRRRTSMPLSSPPFQSTSSLDPSSAGAAIGTAGGASQVQKGIKRPRMEGSAHDQNGSEDHGVDASEETRPSVPDNGSIQPLSDLASPSRGKDDFYGGSGGSRTGAVTPGDHPAGRSGGYVMSDGYGMMRQEGPPGGGGIKLTGLLCPKCRQMCHGVSALKDHMFQVHGIQPTTGDAAAAGARQKPGPSGLLHQQVATGGSNPKGRKGVVGTGARGGYYGDQAEDEESPVACDICDKVFKTRKRMLGHQKRVHKVGVVQGSGDGEGVGGDLLAPEEPAPGAAASKVASESVEGTPDFKRGAMHGHKTRGRPRKVAHNAQPHIEQNQLMMMMGHKVEDADEGEEMGLAVGGVDDEAELEEVDEDDHPSSYLPHHHIHQLLDSSEDAVLSHHHHDTESTGTEESIPGPGADMYHHAQGGKFHGEMSSRPVGQVSPAPRQHQMTSQAQLGPSSGPGPSLHASVETDNVQQASMSPSMGRVKSNVHGPRIAFRGGVEGSSGRGMMPYSQGPFRGGPRVVGRGREIISYPPAPMGLVRTPNAGSASGPRRGGRPHPTMASSTAYGRGQNSISAADIQSKLGLKFGGQISITSGAPTAAGGHLSAPSTSSPRASLGIAPPALPLPPQNIPSSIPSGVSITKYSSGAEAPRQGQGPPPPFRSVSHKPAPDQPGMRRPPPSSSLRPGPSHGGPTPPTTDTLLSVKEEPSELEEDIDDFNLLESEETPEGPSFVNNTDRGSIFREGMPGRSGGMGKDMACFRGQNKRVLEHEDADGDGEAEELEMEEDDDEDEDEEEDSYGMGAAEDDDDEDDSSGDAGDLQGSGGPGSALGLEKRNCGPAGTDLARL